MTPDTCILHLASNDAWLAAVKSGVYHADNLSTEGFIHCSTSSQIMGVANAFYHAQHGLVVLVIDPAKLTAELKWEPPAHPNPERAAAVSDELFPHVYGPLNLDAVVNVISFEPADDGTFFLPSELQQQTLTIRPAIPNDADLAARLMYLSMGELADYLFGGVHRSVEEILAGLYRRNDARFSWVVQILPN